MKYTDFIQEIEKDAEYNDAKEALKAHFALGDAVLRARLKLGWSQTVLARRVGTKPANISRIETGLANPTLALIQKLMRELELKINFVPAATSTTTRIV
ncbi:MAG: XRE family transcriptional regulator [Chloroflexi bacterium]|nr:MAG: XRE family transcriptional regulator [Chloroflexota bacterium]